MSPVPARDQLLSSALFGHYPHSLRGFARGEAWILEVHYQRHRYKDTDTNTCCKFGFFPLLAAGVGLDDVTGRVEAGQGHGHVARQSDNLHDRFP